MPDRATYLQFVQEWLKILFDLCQIGRESLLQLCYTHLPKARHMTCPDNINHALWLSKCEDII
jgi:hypothetical protein